MDMAELAGRRADARGKRAIQRGKTAAMAREAVASPARVARCHTGSGEGGGERNEMPQRGFHPVADVLETSLYRFTVVKLFSSLSSPFHAKCYQMLIWHLI
jgi:hypothetical protein